eukprot:TRINITY_DN4791_c0_g1_i1.p1 TRINITY_DN4791_c0_g1~~TRINITY_DN4791_c0_g1_i1.p1  ORF type:complete len:146 (+),score=46.73 TRINITY_DN4791_c0_g1_i1:310-747(+)
MTKQRAQLMAKAFQNVRISCEKKEVILDELIIKWEELADILKDQEQDDNFGWSDKELEKLDQVLNSLDKISVSRLSDLFKKSKDDIRKVIEARHGIKSTKSRKKKRKRSESFSSTSEESPKRRKRKNRKPHLAVENTSEELSGVY